MIKLAVLIATYARDDPEALSAALISIIHQEIPIDHTINIYLGIDGPIGHELESVINGYTSHLHQIVRSTNNEGLASTLNKLIRCLGEEDFVFRMDADDICLPLRFRYQLDFLREHLDIDIVGTDIIEWDRATNSRRLVSFAHDHEDALRKIVRRVPVAHPTVCFRRQVFNKVPGYPEITGNEDIAMWFECLRKGIRFGNVHLPLLQFTINESFWSRRSVAKALTEFNCYLRGIWHLHKFTWRYIYPIARFFVRISPVWLMKILYNSSFRT
jgi:hypothetical protein